MNNNRLTIISPQERRKKTIYTIIMFILLTIILFISCVFGYNFLYNNNHPVIVGKDTTTTTTTSTTTTTAVVTTTINNYKETKNYIYNYSLIDGDYKVYVCNGDYVSRLTNYIIYNKNTELGVASNINYVIIKKDNIDLTNKPSIKIGVNGKTFNAKYDGRC